MDGLKIICRHCRQKPQLGSNPCPASTEDMRFGCEEVVIAHAASTQSAKVAQGELPPLPAPHVMPAGYYPDQPKVFTADQMREYGKACAEAARQPAPVAVKTWQERVAESPYPEADGTMRQIQRTDAMLAEIADLRVALAATNRSQP